MLVELSIEHGHAVTRSLRILPHKPTIRRPRFAAVPQYYADVKADVGDEVGDVKAHAFRKVVGDVNPTSGLPFLVTIV